MIIVMQTSLFLTWRWPPDDDIVDSVAVLLGGVLGSASCAWSWRALCLAIPCEMVSSRLAHSSAVLGIGLTAAIKRMASWPAKTVNLKKKKLR